MLTVSTIQSTEHMTFELIRREYGLIISGTLQANVGFESYQLGPGDSIAFDSSTPHEYQNKTGDFVHAIWVVVHTEPGRA